MTGRAGQYEDYFALRGITQIRDTGNGQVSCLVHGKPVTFTPSNHLFQQLDDLAHDPADQSAPSTA